MLFGNNTYFKHVLTDKSLSTIPTKINILQHRLEIFKKRICYLAAKSSL